MIVTVVEEATERVATLNPTEEMPLPTETVGDTVATDVLSLDRPTFNVFPSPCP